MDFDLSEEQRLLKESIDSLLSDAYDFEQRKKYMAEKGGWSKAIWGKLAEQGLLGLPFAEADGGFGGGGVETMIVMEALGRALVIEPYLATVVIGGGFLRHGASAEQKAAHDVDAVLRRERQRLDEAVVRKQRLLGDRGAEPAKRGTLADAGQPGLHPFEQLVAAP